MKVLKPDLARDIGADRFLQEIKLTAQLEHPHILTLIDSGVADGFMYYVMPYVEGESLRQKLTREGDLPVDEAVTVLREIADALGYAHGKGIVHRDVKPDNVMFSGRHIVVTDFGVAKAVSDAAKETSNITTAGNTLGTPAYMAPEQAAADPHIDHRVDIYAVGCMAYELLTGQPPFTGASAQQVLSAHVTQAPDAVSKHRPAVPAELNTAVMRCLEKRASDRWQDADELLRELGKATPSGGVPPIQSARRSNASRIAAGAVVALVAALAGWQMIRSSGGSTEATDDVPSVAVLPFTDLSGGEDEYFGVGMAEDLTYALNRIEGLRVAGQSSAFSFAGTDADIETIGAALNVTTVVRGSIRRSGDQLRVTVRLENVADGFQLWSDRYDRELRDVFAIQDEIANSVAEQLEVTLLGERETLIQPGTDDLEAYQLYLRGRFLVAQRGAGLAAGQEALDSALVIDPGFAAAHAERAYTLSLRGLYGDLPPDEAMPQAKAAAERALELDSSRALVHVALGQVSLMYERDWEKAAGHFRRAIVVNPENAAAHMWVGINREWVYHDQSGADSSYQRAIALEPLWAQPYLTASMHLERQGRHEEALAHAQRAVELRPNWVSLRFSGLIHMAQSRARQAVAVLDTALQLSGRHPWVVANQVSALAQAGDTVGAAALYDELVTRQSREFVSLSDIGWAALTLGRLDEGVEWFERAVEERDTHLVSVINYMLGFDLDALEDQRLRAVFQRTGLPGW